jgi:hypothetical protein
VPLPVVAVVTVLVLRTLVVNVVVLMRLVVVAVILPV